MTRVEKIIVMILPLQASPGRGPKEGLTGLGFWLLTLSTYIALVQTLTTVHDGVDTGRSAPPPPLPARCRN
jgi:hypothetical protein